MNRVNSRSGFELRCSTINIVTVIVIIIEAMPPPKKNRGLEPPPVTEGQTDGKKTAGRQREMLLDWLKKRQQNG